METLRKALYNLFVLLKRNPGAIFVILFMISLATAAGFLMAKNEKTAIHIANVAYLFLVIGTIIYMIQLFRERKNDTKEKEPNS